MNNESNKLRVVRLGIDSLHEFMIYMRRDCLVCKSEGFETETRILVSAQGRSIIATLNNVQSDILKSDEVSLSESAWKFLNVKEGDFVTLSHPEPVSSLGFVRSKIYGHQLQPNECDAIIQDIVLGKYSNVNLASFITACANHNLNSNEIINLTQSMFKTGERLEWDYPIIMDKHSVGGIPGNRTTPIIVPIIASAGLIIPKTSSRSITSPAGTADTVEVMTSVTLSSQQIREVVNKEGGCMVWGGALGLSPADDIIIRIERSLDIDPEGQMIASVISKKAAAGATHVVIDMPVGPTAKIRSDDEFFRLKNIFELVGKAVNIKIQILKTEGAQPLGKGIGPALEAKDILAILRNEKNISLDLKNKAIQIAGILLEMGNKALPGEGNSLAKKILENGQALKKFYNICEAQGGFREPTNSSYTHDVLANKEGVAIEINNRNLSKIAKLAGAPHDMTAGIEFFVKLGMKIEKNQLLYRVHAETQGSLHYALSFSKTIPDIITLM